MTVFYVVPLPDSQCVVSWDTQDAPRIIAEFPVDYRGLAERQAFECGRSLDGRAHWQRVDALPGYVVLGEDQYAIPRARLPREACVARR